MKILKGMLAVISIIIILAIGTTTKADTLKVGVISCLSGPGAPWGQGILRGAEMAAEDFNAKGGLKIKGKTYKIKLIAYDDKYTGKGGVAAAEKLVFRDKVKFIIGSIGSASVLAFQKITEKNGVLVLAGSWAKKALGPDKPFTLRGFMTGVEGSPLLISWLVTAFPKFKSVITIAPNDASGWSVTKDVTDAYAKTPIKVISKEYYERGTKDFSPLVNRMKMLNANIVHFAGAPTVDAALMVKLARESGLNAQFVDSTSVVYTKLIKMAGKEFAEGYIWGSFYDPNDPRIKEFEKRYVKKYGKTFPSYVDPAFYHASSALFYSMEKAQSTDPATVRDTMKNIPEFESVMGKVEFGGMETYGVNNQILSVYYATQLRDGKPVIIKKLR